MLEVDEGIVFDTQLGVWVEEGTLDRKICRETEHVDVLARLLDPSQPQCILNFGCHRGYVLRRLMRGRAGLMTAIGVDPSRRNLDIASRNLAWHLRCKAITLIHGAVVETPGPVEIHHPPRNGGLHNTGLASLLPMEDYEAETVPGRAISELLTTYRPSALVIDIEGGEVLLRNTLGRLPAFVSAVVVELHLEDRRISEAQAWGLHAGFLAQGFECDHRAPSGPKNVQGVYSRRSV